MLFTPEKNSSSTTYQALFQTLVLTVSNFFPDFAVFGIFVLGASSLMNMPYKVCMSWGFPVSLRQPGVTSASE